jgi:hypothetical protein
MKFGFLGGQGGHDINFLLVPAVSGFRILSYCVVRPFAMGCNPTLKCVAVNVNRLKKQIRRGALGKTPHGRGGFSRLTCIVVLVQNIAPAVRRPTAPFQCGTVPPQRILVVEDEPDIRQLNTEVLIDFGCRVDAPKKGWSASS